MWNKSILWIFSILFTSWFYGFSRAQIIISATEKEISDISYRVKAFDFPMEDTAFSSSVDLSYGSDSIPVQYSSIIATTVCDDGLCQTLELKMYWSLIGNYMSFDTIPGLPLTKFDHLPFAPKDYEKMHEILANKNSVLERKTLDELFDKDRIRTSNTVDAVTGATAAAVKNAIVEGALYSSYALWHLANGDIKSEINENTKKIYTPELGELMLHSNDYQEQLFVLKLFNDEDFDTYFDSVMDALFTGNPLVEMYILKKLPEEIWKDQTFQNELIASFPSLNINGSSLLFNKLAGLNNVGETGLIFLSEHIDAMNVVQLKEYFSILEKNQYEKHPHIRNNLKAALKSMDEKSFYIEEFLKSSD